MHELSIATRIMEQALDVLKSANGKRALEVRMRIGELSFVSEEQLIFAYEAITQGTPLEGSTLVIEHEDAKVRCQGCGYNGGIGTEPWGFPVLSCPSCAGAVDVVSGKGYLMEHIIIELGDENDG